MTLKNVDIPVYFCKKHFGQLHYFKNNKIILPTYPNFKKHATGNTHFFCLALSSFSFRCRCHKCNIQFETRAELRRHKRKEHPEPSSPVECPVCHKKYNNNYMRDHLKSHNSDAFKCDICEKLFSSRSNLSKHKRKHNPDYVPRPSERKCAGPKRHECEECQKKFDTPTALEVKPGF